MKKNKRILIIGTGAMATLFAAKLSAAGAEIYMLGNWQAGIEALNRHGARIIDAHGNEESYPVHALRADENCPPGAHAIVLVKSWQTEQAADRLKTCLRSDGIALTLQNGLGNGEVLRRFLGEKRVAQGVTVVGATLLSPGQVKISGKPGVSVEQHPRLGTINAYLTEAGVELASLPQVETLIWQKLVINAAINPLSALLNVPNGALLQAPSAEKLLGELAKETASVARAKGIPLSAENSVIAAKRVARQTAENISSMLQDLRRGAPTEIDAICGAIVRTGEKLAIPTPLNRLFWTLIQAKAALANHGKIPQ